MHMPQVKIVIINATLGFAGSLLGKASRPAILLAVVVSAETSHTSGMPHLQEAMKNPPGALLDRRSEGTSRFHLQFLGEILPIGVLEKSCTSRLE